MGYKNVGFVCDLGGRIGSSCASEATGCYIQGTEMILVALVIEKAVQIPCTHLFGMAMTLAEWIIN